MDFSPNQELQWPGPRGELASVLRAHDRVADFELRGGPGGWGVGLGHYAQSTRGRDGRQTAERSQARGFLSATAGVGAGIM
jgi:hypothetical protein